jgi:hypothetical protein
MNEQLGEILIRNGHLTRAQLRRALGEQTRRHRSGLGDLLVELRLCSRSEVEEAMIEQASALPPGTREATKRATETLSAAFLMLRREVEELERKPRSEERGVLRVAISPEKE